MSRLQIASNTLSQLRENQEAAYSRIMDVDVAEETANLIKNQILQKAASAILGQTNMQAKLVLDLL